jgi:hypothetical protein
MIQIVMMVVTLVVPGQPGMTRAVSADWPFFRTMAECQKAVMSLEHAPPAVQTILCETHTLNTNTGRVMR